MLTDLGWLSDGERFPPQSEKERLDMYQTNRDLFEGKHMDVYEDTLKRIERVIGNFQEIVSYPVILNFHKLVSLKTADLLIGEPPIITCGDKGSPEQDTVDAILKNSDWLNLLSKDIIDVSRYGDGLLNIRTKDNNGIISLTQPPIWFPIVSPDDVSELIYHVLAWIYEESIRGKRVKRLKVRIHSKGSYEDRVYEYDGGLIGRFLESKVYKTGLNDFAVIQIPNTITSDRATGIDDYSDFDSIVAELMVRIGQISRILDKHANPSMSGPQAALEKDPVAGGWRLKAGNYFPRDSKDDPSVEYITWNGQLEANFKQVEKLVNFLYTISEMGSALFGDVTNQTGQVASGTALKRLMISPLSKVGRIRTRLDHGLKKAIVLSSQLGGKGYVNLSEEIINISWNDGLPEDPKEMAEIMDIRTGKKPTISQVSAIQKMDGVDGDAAEEEYARIQDDEDAINPMKSSSPFMDKADSDKVIPDVVGEKVNEPDNGDAAE